MTKTSVERDMNLRLCTECGHLCKALSEYHPWLFCLLVKAGVRDPAAYLSELGYTRTPVTHA